VFGKSKSPEFELGPTQKQKTIYVIPKKGVLPNKREGDWKLHTQDEENV
jgi:ankyrin repeat protein